MTTHSVDVLSSRIHELQAQLQDILRAREAAESQSLARRQEAEEALRKAGEQSKAELAAAAAEFRGQSERERQRIEQRHARNLERIERAFSSASSKAREALALETARLGEEKRRARAAEGRPGTPGERSAAFSEVGDLLERARTLEAEIAAFAASVRVRLRDSSEARPPDDVPPGRACETARGRLEQIAKLLAARRRESWVPITRSSWLVTLGCLLLHGAVLLALQRFRPDQMQTAMLVVPISCLGFLLAIILFVHGLKQRAAGAVEPLHAHVSEVLALLRHRESWLKDEELRRRGKLETDRDRALSAAEERLSAQEREARRTCDTRLGILEDQKITATQRSVGQRDIRLPREDARLEREIRYLEERRRSEEARRKEAHARTLAEIVEGERREKEELARRWKKAIEDFRCAAAEARGQSRAAHPEWSDARWRDLKMSDAFPDGVRLGEVRVDLKALAPPPADDPRLSSPDDSHVSLPLHLGFPARGSLVVNMDSATRDRSLQWLFNTVLRILCSFPPGKAKFTLFDPVGLGQSFSALMHLADHDESLVGGRIWTEPGHIEKKLTELTEHIEKVIQKYLRNRYRSVDEYNREVGPMAEPYRFLVIADFPSGLSELALERLASIARSGARCGVSMLILRDRTQKVPAAMDRASLEGGLVVEAVEDGFVVEEKAVREGRLIVEAPPPADALNPLLQSVGRQCAEARRVEISFDIVTPKGQEEWTRSSETGVVIPLGRAGADRLQQLDLGRGTAQHALIAGKTGSGKSTLFHVMITNAALWYSPAELEMYLIDFKKGVEFKTYAVNALPHARVVAIESDREFALSVLRRVYKELGSRAERFRAGGVQDFAGYRRSGAAERLPRTLLMIDEFQEFFTEEDAIAQEAALLLDRIVRQGRAFGVHVVLGSQTLGGSYTLARTTLGQMAVRIALTCNEADSYLILSDDNAAARLLSRPGEAIYNDQSGMIEGNNPFQIAWLPDEVRERLLGGVHERGRREGALIAEPMTVFEGNVPADIRKNPLLNERLARPARSGAAGDGCAWIGEANAIKGPTEVRFRSRRGGNLLIVGQQRESALSVVCSSIVSLAAGHAPPELRFAVLDGSPSELGHGRHFSELAGTIPHALDLVDYARVEQVMEELDAEVTARLEGKGGAGPRICLVIHDLQHFRKLRQKEEFDFSPGEEQKRTADRCFANILGEGPAQKVHAIVWCDSLTSLNRMLNRKTLKEFDMRVLFQMSAADSSELIDAPTAGKLGLYRGLLFLEEEGTVEKFRPYAMPDPETLKGIGRALRGGAAE